MKKRNRIALIASLALFGFTTVACGQTTETGKETATENTTTSATTESTPKEVTYQVNFIKESYVNVVTTGLSGNQAKPGAEIRFTMENTSALHEITSITIDNGYLKESEGEYVFTMPEHDVTVTITSESLGQESLLQVSDVDLTDIPSTSATLKEYLEKSSAVEGTYFQSGHITNDNLVGMISYYDYDIVAGRNDVVIAKGQRKSSKTDTASTFYRSETGKTNEIYYSIEETSTLSSSPSITKNHSFKNIVSDDTEGSLSSDQIKAADAKIGYTSFGATKSILNTLFNGTYSVDDWTEGTTDKGTYHFKDLTKAISEDKKTITFDFHLYLFTYWSETEEYQVSLTFDGDKFLNHGSITKTLYGSGLFDKETLLPLEGAKGTVDASYEVSLNRGLKKTEEKTDIGNYAMENYDVEIQYELNDVDHKADKNAPVVENGSILSFSFLGKDDHAALITPTFVGVGEGEEDFLDLETMKVKKEGQFTLRFNNGFGIEKKVNVTSIRPKAVSIRTVVPSTIYLNENTNVTLGITPEEALQDVNVTKAGTSIGDVEITKGENGAYILKGTKLGQVDLHIESVEDSTITKDISFNVMNKPSAETFKNNAFTKTFYGESNDYKGVVNFNEDGSGEFKTANVSSWGSYYDNPKTFHWTFDETTLTFTITDAEGSYYSGRGFYSFSAITEETAEGTFGNYNWSDEKTEFKLTLTAQDRKELSEFTA